MNNNQSFRKYRSIQRKIADLERNNTRFKRIYSEYENLTEELWDLESSDVVNVSDDYLESVIEQTNCLEDEIEDWLQDDDV